VSQVNRVGLYFTASTPLADELLYARLAERFAFTSIWQGESRTERDSTISIAAMAAVTGRIGLGTGVLHTWTRNVVTLATTFSTLDELSGGRVRLGIGALWEPMASKIGIERKNPLNAVREYVQVLKSLFKGEEVNFSGQFIHVTGIRLERVPQKVPVYVGATGIKMAEVAGEVADGVLLNYLVSPEYNSEMLKHIEIGAKKAGRTLNDIDRPQLLAVSYSLDQEKAFRKARWMVAEYLAMEPHIAIASGASEKTIDEIRGITGGWPTTREKLEQASGLVEERTVKRLMAVGDLEECRKQVSEYERTGCTEPILFPVTGEVLPLIHHFGADSKR
jgi:5,10-methylenetetrahydromethanopterin reductase